ncbi:hypothetical protein TspCOW1_02710 [Thiohalobacter sp. COW1]|uniref:Pyruvate:ferredoxin oxidoreductase and related 2-oxoacid:ferredoxin oxidoreductases, beta subunit n=1 Tax=Thiohalobacter thiocyanaticus TaxID=585455 RepID=A0A1Z4VU90_9GAMM|nr:pyruvate:ferredoxin oxidoreductase and related 2-oxoacid:ferredoxin oxidoreductases, beta subunit [Thiohalobacter thiocyanaticus]BCO30168.1 hypothetical protein TspCOW1_02710 [Thiohalobacter sp. COW1]
MLAAAAFKQFALNGLLGGVARAAHGGGLDHRFAPAAALGMGAGRRREARAVGDDR